ncbi:hypothetical protein LNQ49_00960 [Flavobacterium sp. F-65]|uniref:PKD-like domain-containing protein n=1 Tax=Flavobacterium pisciphilum TaxID=2893755 RepID=A0ABS8MN34_9FLAO|nr:hypothetical protein [Flavobacterium sp. F-65]MCC9070175.1 hypothetical protein [Flavobacterium sp. F-65]
MNKYIKYSLCIVVISALYCCSNDDSKPETVAPEPVLEASLALKLEPSFATTRYKVAVIDPEVTIENANNTVAQYKWTVKVSGKDGVAKDSIIGDTKTLNFIMPKAGDYNVDLTVTLAKVIKQASTKVTVSETGLSYNSKALSIIDYLPSPYPTMDDYAFTTKAEVLEQVKLNLEDESAVPLGTFGGYIVAGFDHTVINAYGKRDFIIKMNTASSTNLSPVSIYVAYDKNKNGVADENEWYEIAGSEHNKSTTIKNYEVTYFKPDPNKTPVAGTADWQFDKEYIKWTDNKNTSGTITKTNRGKYSDYYPQWVENSYTLKGTKLYIPVKDISDGEGINFNVGTFEWGYGGIKDSSIDISWAVDANGKKVHLAGIDFVKVYVSTFVELGSSGSLTNYFEKAEDINFVKTK